MALKMELSTLDVVGYKKQKVPNTFITHSVPSQHLGVILPGYRHSPDMADLNYAGRILLEQGADLLRVEYVYYYTNFLRQSESEQNRWISEDVFAVLNTCLSLRTYTKLTFVGKSLGAKAIGLLLADDRFKKASCVWSTPPLTAEWLCAQIEKIRPRSLFIMGTADKFYSPEIINRLERVTNGKSVIIEGADHGLEIPESIPKSLVALRQIVQALQEFLSDSPISA